MEYTPTIKKGYGFEGERIIVPPTEIFQGYAEHPLVKRLYLTDIGLYPCAKHHFCERTDGIEEYIFFFCIEGNGIISVEDKEYHLHTNEAFCIPKYKKHFYYACEDNPWGIFWIHFQGEDTIYYPLEDCLVIPFQSKNAINQILYLFERLFQALDGNYTLNNFIYISQILSLLLSETYYQDKQNTIIEPNKHVTDVIRYMYKHLYENLSMDQIVQEFELSKSYLNAIFKKCTRHAPMDFYIRLKMQEACKLLRSTDSYVYEVAQKLGYQDQYYFSRLFKKVIGVSPNEYKNSNYFENK